MTIRPLKKPLGKNVLTAARERISIVFDRFERIYVSFSAGKDSTVMLHLVADEARRRGRKFGLLLIDLEAQYRRTIEHGERCFDMYSDCIEPYWVALPISLRNAVSQFEPQWLSWDPSREADWVRRPPERAITEPTAFPFFTPGDEFEDFIEDFALWFGQGRSTACFVGIRSDESLNRFRTLIIDKTCFEGLRWTTWVGDGVFNAYPIYDWRTEDIWTFSAKSSLPQNGIYDLMMQAGVPLSAQRICQPYGDDQRRGLWLFHLLEPETWARVVARVSGANAGALYARERGSINGVSKISKPQGYTWQGFAMMLLKSMPDQTRMHYENKIWVFLKWWMERGYPTGIPDEADPKEEAKREAPSWRRICKSLLRNDYWCKGLSFSQHTSHRYEAYLAVMKKRREKWKFI